MTDDNGKPKIGDSVAFTICGRNSMRRANGVVHHVGDDHVLCRLNKGKGKREYHVPFTEIITGKNDPLRSFMSAWREANFGD